MIGRRGRGANEYERADRRGVAAIVVTVVLVVAVLLAAGWCVADLATINSY